MHRIFALTILANLKQVKCQQTRSRFVNRLIARDILAERIRQIENVEESKKFKTIEKVRRKKAKAKRRLETGGKSLPDGDLRKF